jgi:hypothetical protein
VIYRIETPQGLLPYEFKTEKEAKDYAIGILSWSNTRYRIHRMRRSA